MGTSAAVSGKSTSGAHKAMGADSSQRCPPGPREDDRVGKVRTPSPPLPTEEGAAAADGSAPGGVTASSFFFFAASRPLSYLQLSLCLFRSSLRPDAYTLPFLLLAAARCPAPAFAVSAHALLQKLGLQDHDHTVHSLITMYSNLGCPRADRKVFNRIP